MNPKTIRLFAALGTVGLALAVAGIGSLPFGPNSSKTAAPPILSSALAATAMPAASPEPPSTQGSATAPTAGKRHALLIGVGTYQYADGKYLPNLVGPSHDVQAMAQVLDGWGFDSITVLQGAEATHAHILQKLDELTRVAEPGGHILFYYSGHGTSPQDPNLGLPLPHTTGALLAHDSRIQGDPEAVVASLIVGRRDLRPRFEALDRKGVYTTALIDACYSQNATRAWTRRSRRQVAAPALDLGEFGSGSIRHEPYPYRQVTTLTASAANQTAWDIDDQLIRRFPTLDQQPHGAFTDALLRALRDRALPEYGALDKNADQRISVEEFFVGVSQFMARRQYDHTPMLQPTVAEMSARTPVRQLALFYTDGAAQTPPPAPPDTVQIVPRLRVSFAGARPPWVDLDAIEWVSADADLTLESEGAGYALYDAAGRRVGTASDRNALREQLRRRAVLERLTATAQQAGRTTVSLALAAAGTTTRLPLGSTAHPVQTRMMLAADQAGYPLVFDLFGDGATQRLYPYYPEEARRRWSAGASIDVLCVKTAPPAGVDAVYAFWLAEPWPSMVLERTQRIAASDSGVFDVVLARLSDSAKILGATRLTVEVYPPAPGELKAWTTTCEK